MRTAATFILIFATALPAAAQPVMYTVMDLGPGVTRGINSSGQTAGYYGTTPQAFRASPTGQVTLLGNGYGLGINDLGQVVGEPQGSSGGFVTTPTGDLSTATFLSGPAIGVNNNGQVVGFYSPAGNHHAYRTSPGGVFDSGSDLGTFPGGTTSSAGAINGAGQVAAGSAIDAAGDGSIFRTTATGTLTTADNLGTLGGTLSQSAGGINASGQVVGYSFLPGNAVRHAFRSSPNGQPIHLQDLGSLLGSAGNSTGQGINALGVVVGYSDSAGGQAGFLFDTSMHNLNTMVPAGWDIISANAINDSGWIAAQGTFNGGSQEALVLIPTGVPEPSTLALAGLAGICVAARRLRNRRRRAALVG